MSLEATVSKLNKTTEKLVNNQNFGYILKALLILYVGLSVPKLLNNNIEIFDNVVVRLLCAGLVVYLSHYDATLALLLAIVLVVSIQELNVYKTQVVTNNIDQFYGGEDTAQPSNELVSGGECPNNGSYFTTDNELNDAQDNVIQDTNSMSQVQTWDNQLGPQGLNQPYGYSGPNQNDASAKPSIGQFASEF